MRSVGGGVLLGAGRIGVVRADRLALLLGAVLEHLVARVRVLARAACGRGSPYSSGSMTSSRVGRSFGPVIGAPSGRDCRPRP